MSTEASPAPAAAIPGAPIPSSIPNQSALAARPAVPAPAAATPAPAAPATPAAGEPPAPDLSRGFASLAAEERRIRTDRDAFKAEKATFAAQTQALQAARANPRDAMRFLGFSDDQVLEALAGGPPAAPAVDDRVTRLEQTLAQRDQQAAAERTRQENLQREQQADQVINQFRNDVTGRLKEQAGDKYALIAAYGAEGEVTARIEKHLLERGELLPWAQVADQVEQECEAKARKALEHPKLKLVPSSETRNGPPSEQRSPTTLTNRGTNGPAPPALPPLPLDPDARTAELLRRRGLAS